MKKILIILTLFSVTLLNWGAKIDKENADDLDKKLKEYFLEAESNFLYEEYTEALPLYLKISKKQPNNANISYKIGICYLNIPYEKEKSIAYLEKASLNISSDYNAESYKETGAPFDVLFYLGNAYRINNQFDLALKTYEKFKSKLDPEIYDESLVNEQIKSIDRALKLQKRPVFFDIVNIGENVNTKFSDFNPVISYNGKVLAYNVKLQFYDALYVSILNEKGDWSFPNNIIPELGVDGDVYATSLNADGTELYLYRSDNFDGNLYVTHFNQNTMRWSAIVKLNDNINTKYWESHACVSADGKTLYFTSNRKGSIGGLDIYKAKRLNGDNWQDVVNIGPEVNTEYNEETPFISEDEKTLWFSSYGHYNIGGYDVFYSSLIDNKWSVPLNMGYPINTTDDDLFLCPSQNGSNAYISRYYPDGYGKNDIYRLDIYNNQHPRKFKLKGILNLDENASIVPNSWLVLKLIDRSSNDTIQRLTINPADGKYNLNNIMAGRYKILIEGLGYDPINEDFVIDNDQLASDIYLKSLLKKRVSAVPAITEASLSALMPTAIPFLQSFYKITEGGIVEIVFPVTKGAKVSLNVRVDSILVKTSESFAKKDLYKLTYKPVAGSNVLKFKVVNPNSSVQEGEVLVICTSEPDAIMSIVKGINLGSKRRMSDFIAALSILAPSSIQGVLTTIDIEKDNITTPDDLSLYLKNKSQYSNYTPKDVDDLFALYSQLQAQVAQNITVALKQTANGSFASIIDTLNWANYSIIQPLDVANTIVSVTSKNKSARYGSLAAMAALAFAGDLYYVQKQLSVVATDRRLRTYLENTNFKSMGITDADDLFTTLISAANRGLFPPAAVYAAFTSLPAYTTSAPELLNDFIAFSDPSQKEILSKINTRKLKINTSEQLVGYLMSHAPLLGLNATNLIRAMLLASYQHHLETLFDKIQYYSEGNLHTYLNNKEYKKLNISSLDELLSYLVNNSAKNNYSTSQILNVLTIIAADNQGLPIASNVPDKGKEYNHFATKMGKIQLSIMLLLLMVGGIMVYKGMRK